jgi:general secretion pathway protein F
MPAFDYSAYNAQGQRSNGVISADSPRHARRLLKEKLLQPYELREVGEQKERQQHGWGRGKVSTLDLSILLRQQAILTQSGLAMAEALRMTMEQAETRNQRRMVQSWRTEILEGRSFSEALRRSPYTVPQSVIAGVGVGEESGHLHQILLRLADELESSAENRQTIRRALIYPATLIATSMVVIGIMMVWVVPKITLIFNSSKRELPLVTRVVVALSDFTQAYGLPLLLLLIALVFGFAQACRNPQFRMRWHKAMLAIPVLGRWMSIASIADWSRSLGVMLGSGVPALAALRISSSVVGNLHLRHQMEQVTECMKRGSSLHKALEDSGVNSGFLIHMVASGEASSELDLMLKRVADYYTLRLKSAVDIFLKVLNPMLIIFMGLIILSVVAAVMLPIMDMNNMI